MLQVEICIDGVICRHRDRTTKDAVSCAVLTFLVFVFHSLLVNFGVDVVSSAFKVRFALNAFQFDDAVTFDVLHVGHVLAPSSRVIAQLAFAVQILAVPFVRCGRQKEREKM